MWLWWAIALPAIAEPPLDAEADADGGIGEYNRLSEEIERLASKNAWAGSRQIFLRACARAWLTFNPLS